MKHLKTFIHKLIEFLLMTMKGLIIIFFRNEYIGYEKKENIINDNLEELMDFKELVKMKGFDIEDHKVITSDGYILTLHRLKYVKYKKIIEKPLINLIKKKSIKLRKREGDKSQRNINRYKQPILFVHGIFDSSDGWVCNDEDKSLPLLLSKLGYDVWLGNSRGNKYSKNHVKLNEKINHSQTERDNFTKEFWNFSFEEMGKNDLPAFIDHILKYNNQFEKITYIGHSQGTTQFFSGFSENNEYFQKKIKLFIGLAPVAKTKHLDSPLYTLFDLIQLDHIAEFLGFTEMFPNIKEVQMIFTYLFKKFPIFPTIATEIIGDKNSISYNNYNRLPILFSHLPSGSSLKALNHLVQMFRSDRFCKFDYGKKLNIVKYGSESSPDFNLDKIKNVPIALFSGKNDRLAHPKDVHWLNNQLKENIVFSKSYDYMGHISFQISQSFQWIDDVLNVINKFSN